MKYEIDITKVKGQWVVGKPSQTVMRGRDSVEWTLHAPAVSAHFQFTNTDQHSLFSGPGLTRDLTATIPRAGEKLELFVSDSGCKRHKHRYAVWVQEAEGVGQFAVGADRNPPPEIDVGP